MPVLPCFGASTFTVTITGGISSIVGGTGTATGPLVSFANANNVTFGVSGNTITASIQTAGGTASGVGISASGSMVTSGVVSFANTNGVSFGLSGSVMTASIAGASQTPFGVAAGTQTATSGTVEFANSNGLTFGLSGSSRITGSYSTAIFANANNVSFGTNGSTVTATVSFPAATQYVFNDANNVSFGTNGSTVTATASFPAQSAFVLSSSNGVSFGTNGSTVTARVASVLATGAENFLVQGASAGTISAASIFVTATALTEVASNVNISAAAGTLAMFGNNQVVIQAGGNMFLQPQGALSISATGGIRIANTGAGSVRIGSVSNSIGFFDSQGVTKQTLTGTNAVAVNNLFAILGSHGLISNNATVSAFATGNLGAIAAGTQTASSGTVLFGDANNVSFGMNASSLVTATVNAAPPVVIAAGVSTQTLGTSTLVFDNANSVGWLMFTTVANQLRIQAQVTALKQLRAGTQTATSVAVFVDANNVSFGMVGNSQITASIPAGVTATGNLGAIAAGTQTGSSGTIAFLDSNSISFGMANSSQITASINFPAQSAFVLSSSNGVSFGTNGSTVTARVASVSATGAENFFVQGASNGSILAARGLGVTASSLSVVASQDINIGANGVLSLQGGASVIVQAVGPLSLSAGGGVRIANTGAGSVVIGSTGNSIGFFDSVGITKQTLTGTDATAINNLFAILGSHGLISNNATVGPFGGGGIAFAAGTQTATSGTVVLANANSISFGMAGSSQITASVNFPTQSAFVLSSSNGVSFGTNGSTVTARVATLLGTAGEQVGISASGGDIFLSNANSRIFMTAQTIQGTAPVVNLLGQAQAALGNSVGFGRFIGSTGSFQAPYVLIGSTNGSLGFFGVGTAPRQTVTGSNDTQINNLINALNSYGLISATGNITFGGGLAIAAGTQTGSTGTIVLADSNSISFGMAGSSQITASINFPAQSAFALSSSNGVSFGTNASTVTARVASVIATGTQNAVVTGASNVSLSAGINVVAVATSNISLQAGVNVTLTAGTDGVLSVGRNLRLVAVSNISATATNHVSLFAGQHIVGSAASNISLSAGIHGVISAQSNITEVAGGAASYSAGGNVSVQAGSLLVLNGGIGVSLTGNGVVLAASTDDFTLTAGSNMNLFVGHNLSVIVTSQLRLGANTMSIGNQSTQAIAMYNGAGATRQVITGLSSVLVANVTLSQLIVALHNVGIISSNFT